eukprot:scaffold605388_cov17-Prasinocladus_malaysianus.AAC.1
MNQKQFAGFKGMALRPITLPNEAADAMRKLAYKLASRLKYSPISPLQRQIVIKYTLKGLPMLKFGSKIFGG